MVWHLLAGRSGRPLNHDPSLLLSDIEVFHPDRGSEFRKQKIEMMLDMFSITTPLSYKGNSYGNAVIESTNRLIKKEMVYRASHTAGEQGRQ